MLGVIVWLISKCLPETYSKHHSGKERRRKGQKAKANSDSPDPCSAPAEFQVWCLSAVQEIQLRLQSIFSLGSDHVKANTPLTPPLKHTHGERTRAQSSSCDSDPQRYKTMHCQNTAGATVSIWKTSCPLPLFTIQLSKATMTSNASFKTISIHQNCIALYSALTFNDKFLHRPENDQRAPKTSVKSWKSQFKTHPILTFSPFLLPPFFRKKARSTVQTSLSSICEVIRCKVTQTLQQICGSLG